MNTCVLLLYSITVNTILTGLSSGFTFGLFNNFYASVLQQKFIWSIQTIYNPFSTARTFFCVCHTSGCSFYVLKAVLAVWRHVQVMLHAQTARCPIVNSCSELPSLWSGEICKHLGLTERAGGFHMSTLICWVISIVVWRMSHTETSF